jgi:hypothetical protein
MAAQSSDYPTQLRPRLEAIARLSGVLLRTKSPFQWLGKYMKRIIAAFAAVAAVTWPAAVFTYAGVARADDYAYVPLLASRAVFKGETALVLSAPVSVKPGDMVRVSGQLAISIPGGHKDPEVDNAVTCFDQYGHTIPGNPAFGSGTNYMGDNDAFLWNASILLVAPKPLPADHNGVSPLQAFFTCGIMVSAVDYQTTVLAPTPGQTTHGTWLEVSSSPDPGAQQWWWYPPPGSSSDICPTNDKASTGPSKCVYLGGPNANSLSIFQNSWTASKDATVVDFVASGQNTVCFLGTGSCREIDDGPGDYSHIMSWLNIQQLDQNSNPCGAATLVYSEDTVKGDAETDTEETLSVSRYQHHLPVYYHATVPVSQLCGGSRTFATSLYTQLASGIPIKFENKNLNVINLERAPTTTVPPVVGLTAQQATAAIVAARLYTGAPDNVTSTAPPGTVLSQNSPGGTVEPVGSQVQITVSLGQTTVPDVLGDPMAAAEQTIKSAGLTPVTLAPINNCADESAQGKVQHQNPVHPAQVAPGAQVEIQTIYCNR